MDSNKKLKYIEMLPKCKGMVKDKVTGLDRQCKSYLDLDLEGYCIYHNPNTLYKKTCTNLPKCLI